MNRFGFISAVVLSIIAAQSSVAQDVPPHRPELRRLPTDPNVVPAWFTPGDHVDEGGGFPEPAVDGLSPHQPTIIHTYTHSSALGGFHRPDQMTCWYGGIGYLYLDRDGEDNSPLTQRSTTAAVLLDTDDAAADWTNAGKVTLGRYMNPCLALELTYWELDPARESASTSDPNDGVTAPNLVSVLDFSPLEYDDLGGGGANLVSTYFDDARIHRLQRDWQFRNVEINLVRVNCCGEFCGCNCYPWSYSVRWSAGIRYIRFEDQFNFASDPVDTAFTGNNSEVAYAVDVDSDVLAFQIGCQGDFYWNHRGAVRLGLNVGGGSNFIEKHSFVGGSAGPAVVAGTTDEVDVRSDTTDAALLAESEVGIIYQFSHHLRLVGGYRVFVLAGVAESTSQIPADFGDLDSIGRINRSDTLLLHGAFGSLEFNY